MARRFRFFVSPDQLKADNPRLEAEELHHALHVARVRTGEEVEVFDGHGRIAACEVLKAGKRDLLLQVTRRREEPRPARELTLVVAYPNRERTVERIVESGVPLGVSRFVFFASTYSDRAPELSDKWERWGRESCKQSFRSWVPEFAVACGLESALPREKTTPMLLLTPDGPDDWYRGGILGAASCICIVGPEGGLSDAEVKGASAYGAIPVGLGEYVLRTELACATIAAIVTHTWRCHTHAGC